MIKIELGTNLVALEVFQAFTGVDCALKGNTTMMGLGCVLSIKIESYNVPHIIGHSRRP